MTEKRSLKFPIKLLVRRKFVEDEADELRQRSRGMNGRLRPTLVLRKPEKWDFQQLAASLQMLAEGSLLSRVYAIISTTRASLWSKDPCLRCLLEGVAVNTTLVHDTEAGINLYPFKVQYKLQDFISKDF